MRKEPLFPDFGNRKENGPSTVALEQVVVSRTEDCAGDSGCTKHPDRVEMYEETFLRRSGGAGRKVTCISGELHAVLSRILPLLGDGMTVPAFLDNVLSHHMKTYGKEMEELVRRKLGKVRF